jgi:hypothetical protein
VLVMAGYDDKMKQMFREQNEGLSRRLNAHSPFVFADYTDSELLAIFARKCSAEKIECGIKVKMHAARKVGKGRALPNFGNAGAVDNLYQEAKGKMTDRINKLLAQGKTNVPRQMEIIDVEGFQDTNVDKVEEALKDLLGMEEEKAKLMLIGKRAKLRQTEGGKVSDLLRNYVFTGAPGTGNICFRPHINLQLIPSA